MVYTAVHWSIVAGDVPSIALPPAADRFTCFGQRRARPGNTLRARHAGRQRIDDSETVRVLPLMCKWTIRIADAGGRGRDLGLRCRDRVAVEQRFSTD